MQTSDPLFQNFLWAQSDKQPTPATIASADEVVITTGLTIITGTTAITKISGRTRTAAEVSAAAYFPPLSGFHVLVFIFTDGSPGGVGSGYNISATLACAQYVPMLLFYNPATGLYRAAKLAIS